MTVKVKDNVDMDAYLGRLRNVQGVKVGIMGNKAVEAKTTRGDTENPELTVIQVAQQHEFGIGVPERSFIRAYHDENEAWIEGELLRIAKNMAKSKARNPGLTAMGNLGLKLVDGIVTRIEAGIPPENSEETKERKGSATPLIDTGQLKSSIIYQVMVRRRSSSV